MAIAGNSILLMVNTGTDAAPTFTAVGEQQGLSYDASRDMIETSNKNSDHTTFVYGRASGKMSLDALYVPADAGFAALKDAMDNKTVIKVRRSENGTDVEEADALIAGMSYDYPDNDVATCSVDLTLNGPFTAVVAP